jgi:hypothetical protein
MQHRTPLKITELWDYRRDQDVWKLSTGTDERVSASSKIGMNKQLHCSATWCNFLGDKVAELTIQGLRT